jgi:hypothetical protein
MAETKLQLLPIEEFFGDGRYKFKLDITRLRELQEKTDSGPMQVLTRLRLGHFKIDDVRETIRLGLIGAGTTPSAAHSLVTRYFDLEPIGNYAALALDIMIAALFGVDPDAPKDGEAPEVDEAAA